MSTTMFRLGVGAVLGLALAGCNLPRGAAFESEVLGARAGADGEATRDFAVEEVTRDALPRYSGWPRSGEPSMSWISHQGGPANRIIAPGDVLAVTLWNTEDNSLLTAPGQRAITMNAVTVSSTGSIFMPYIGNIKVSGMSPDHARETVEGRFAEVTPSAQVQLEIAESRGSMVSLVGGVQKPGAYPMRDQSFTVLSLIAEGGGVNSSMNNPQVRLMRGGEIYGISLDRLFSEPSLDTTLRPGDKVIVEPDERFFMSLGAAGSEAVQQFPRDDVSALEAISIIGGVSDARANPKGILVLRQYPASAVRSDGTGPTHERVVFTLDLTTADGLFSAGEFPIQSGDLVYATESPVTSAQTIFSILGNSLGIVRQSQRLSE
ncbi:polysaccharide biosynthesis/export family protein [Rubellimicrobium arenae]|uniref:polysaccharide biosynthesis/export family protein n=1 Tax=Rubellimicrobium arenae TaxID=2817372 RepID=UPI001FEF14BF|nr:polysaccharide biosynthesis/export family protein [Rubellimicrobium arenae]